MPGDSYVREFIGFRDMTVTSERGGMVAIRQEGDSPEGEFDQIVFPVEIADRLIESIKEAVRVSTEQDV